MSGGSWKVAYADFMTAMMAFFLLMWILSMVPKEQQAQIAGFFQDPGGFSSGNSTLMSAPTAADPEAGKQFEVELFNLQLAEKLKDKLKTVNMLDQVAVSVSQEGVNLRVPNDLTFASNSFALTPKGTRVVESVSSVLGDKINVSVRGHADPSETGAPTFNSNWELSAVRAGIVADYLVNVMKVNPVKVSVSAYGATMPLGINDGSNGSPTNRRVEFLLYRSSIKLSPSGL